MAVQFEERVYSVSKTKLDYLRKISLKMSNVRKFQKSNHPVSSPTSSVSNSGQNSDIHKLLGILPNAERTSIGQDFSSDAFSNSLEQIQQRQSVVSQLQNLRNTQLQPHQQSQIQQQQNLLLSTQVQFPQKSVMQTSQVMQTGLHQSTSSMLQQEQVQQPQLVYQQQSSLSQKPQLLSQQSHMGQLSSIANLLQNQLTGPENSSENLQNHQQQQRLLGRTNNQSSLQQQWPAQQNISFLSQQLDPCSNISGLQRQQHQQQLLGSQSGNSDLQTNQHSVYMLQQSENPVQQQTPTSLHSLPSSKLPLLSHTQSQPSQDMILQQKTSHMQQSMQQRSQRAGSFLGQPNVIDEQSQLYQSQRFQPDTSTSQSVQANEAIQEQVYQKIKTLKDMYLHELNDLHQRISTKTLQQPQRLDQMDRWRLLKHVLERWLAFIQMSKSDITLGDKDKLAVCEKHILSFIRHRRQENPTQMMHQTQQPQSKTTPVQSDGTQTNSELQELQLQSSMPEVQQNTANLRSSNTTRLLQNSMSTAATEQGIISPVQQNSSSGKGNAMNSSKQVAIGSLQQDSEPANPNNLSSQSGVNALQSSIDLLQHHKHQDQQLLQTQQFDIEIQQCRMQQQPVQMKTQEMSHRQHSSPEIYQQNLLTKAGTPSLSESLPIVFLSPLTPRGPSPMPGDGNKNVPALPMHLNAENHGSLVMSTVAATTHSHASGSPREATSIENFTNHGDTHGNASLAESGQLTEQPIQRLIRAVRSVSPETLRANVAKIASVIGMSDRIAGSAPGNGSKAAVGEELVPMTDNARHNMMQDQIPEKRKMRRFFSISSSNIASSGSCIGDPFKQLSSPTPSAKRPRIMDKHALLEEIKHINQRFIDTSLSVSDEDNDAAKNNEGIIVKCSYNAIALSPELKSRYASHLSQIQPLRLFVPLDYPNTPPQFLDKFSVEVSDDCEEFSSKAKSRFGRSIRSLGRSVTLLEIAKTWDSCTRGVIIEYAQKSGGGTFSSIYGTWEEYC